MARPLSRILRFSGDEHDVNLSKALAASLLEQAFGATPLEDSASFFRRASCDVQKRPWLLEAPEGVLHGPCRGFCIFWKMEMVFAADDGEGRGADFARGVARSGVFELRRLQKSVFSRAGARECSRRGGFLERGGSKWEKGRFLREGSQKVQFQALKTECRCKTGGAEA